MQEDFFLFRAQDIKIPSGQKTLSSGGISGFFCNLHCFNAVKRSMPDSQTHRTTATFGTLPVFMTTISTILGAILFLRFGYAVGHQGFIGVIGIIFLGHMVTIPTAMAVAEIATNQKVQGGGAYYIISRSFGINIGSAIGIALYLSQAISVAFYVIAFSEAFDPLIRYLHYEINTPLIDKRWVGLASMSLLSLIILTRGANIGMKALYFVVALLFTSLLFFFLGKSKCRGTAIYSKCPDSESR